MSTISVGRLSVNGIDSVTFDGSRLKLGSDWDASTVEAAKAYRDQVLGLAENPDEPIVPVAFSEDATLDGFYRVLGTSCSSGLLSLTTGRWSWSVDLERVPGYAAPVVELFSLGRARASKPAGVTALYQVGIPGSWKAIETGTAGGATRYTRAVTGSLDILWFDGLFAALARGRTTAVATPATYYDAACYVKVGPDATGYHAIGRQTINAVDGTWEVGNGLVRITPPATPADNLCDIEFIDDAGTTWSTAVPLLAGYTSNAAAYTDVASLTVLRNSPEQVTVRMVVDDDADDGAFTLDLMVQRGSRIVQATIKSRTIRAWYLGLDLAAGSSYVDANNAGRVETSDNADGNRFVILGGASGVSWADYTQTLNPAGTNLSAGITCEIGGTGASNPDRETDLQSQWHGALGLRQQIVAP